jgi:hypothetical protein
MKHLYLLIITIFSSLCAWFFLYPYHFALPYFETDFVDYCVGVATWEDLQRHFPPKRSRLAGMLPWLWRDSLGILQSLSTASTISMIAVGCILTHWSERIRPNSGWFTLAVLLACSPWIGSGRLLNFYPEILLGPSLSSWLVWMGMTPGTSTPQWLRGLMIGIGIGLSALIDARGLIWTGWFGVVAISWTLSTRTLKPSVERLFGMTVPIGLSWWLGQWVYGIHATSLIRQLDVRPLRYALSLPDATPPPYTLPAEFVWGREFTGIFDNIAFILSQQSQGLPSGAPSAYWVIWLGIIGISILTTCKQHWRFWVVGFPFLIAYLQVGHAVENHVRFYIQSLPPLIIGVGLCIATLTEQFPQRWRIVCIATLMILLPYLSMVFGPHWTIEREISHKMLTQAHPNEPELRTQTTLFGTPIHIQTLPVTQQERRITQDWDMLCTEALSTHSPILWFERP